ncbi:hypothetical protein B0H19DRAFT_1079877 [Mycena capillaripes]|nr:hypothetical protein B0H19DRAFT_1079877 [Mycena capillaripes]
MDSPSLRMFDQRPFEMQRKHQDIVLYSHMAGQAVRVAWPLVNGHRIPAKFILDFLQKNDLHWSCFCVLAGIDNDTPLSCYILDAGYDGVFAYCHYARSSQRCRFFLDLSTLYRTTALEQEYPGLPTRVLGEREPLVDAPYFPGFFGEPVVYFPGAQQLGGKGLFLLHVPLLDIILEDISSAKIEEEPIKSDVKKEEEKDGVALPLAPGSKVSQGSQTMYCFGESTHLVLGEMQLLRAISRMDGLTKDEVDTILTRCRLCSLYFPYLLLISHSVRDHGGRVNR